MENNIDAEIDSSLMRQFSTLGTDSKDDLINQLQKFVGHQLNPDACAFFLDMNNWNLQAAICSYYDYDPAAINLPHMTLVKDVTIGEGESVRPNTNFVKTWRIKNPGLEHWPPACSLKFLNGHRTTNSDFILVGSVAPGNETDVSVDMTSPPMNGIYQSQWRMQTPTGTLFGDIIWCIIQVSQDGILDVTQQMSRFGTGQLGVQQTTPSDNPFLSRSTQNQPMSNFETNTNINPETLPDIINTHHHNNMDSDMT